MDDSQSDYRSFLLRLWRESQGEDQPWRIVLVDPHTDQRWGFTEIDQLTSFLQDQVANLYSDNKDKA